MATTDHSGFNASLTDYLRVVFCKCPRCGERAVIRGDSCSAVPWIPKGVRFTCPSCALDHGWPVSTWKSDFSSFNPADALEPYFGYRLWAVGRAADNVLAIFNHSHADDLSAYVGLRIRPRPQNVKWAMVNRLPKWLLLGKNREKVLGLVEELRMMLPAKESAASPKDETAGRGSCHGVRP